MPRFTTSLAALILNETITAVQRVASGKDAYGNALFGEASASVSGCSVQPLTTQEILGNGDQVEAEWRLFAPASFNYDAYDYFVANGVKMEVTGDVLLWPNADHCEILAKRWEG